jgi:hypothetical protein
MLDGKKTILAAAALFLFALLGLYTGKLDGSETVKIVLEAAAIYGLRDAIAKK